MLLALCPVNVKWYTDTVIRSQSGYNQQISTQYSGQRYCLPLMLIWGMVIASQLTVLHSKPAVYRNHLIAI